MPAFFRCKACGELHPFLFHGSVPQEEVEKAERWTGRCLTKEEGHDYTPQDVVWEDALVICPYCWGCRHVLEDHRGYRTREEVHPCSLGPEDDFSPLPPGRQPTHRALETCCICQGKGHLTQQAAGAYALERKRKEEQNEKRKERFIRVLQLLFLFGLVLFIISLFVK
jgi:hypothetical protein